MGLANFVNKPGSNDFRLPPMPKVAEFIALHGFKEWPARYDSAMEEYRQQMERLINERVKPTETATTTVTKTAVVDLNGINAAIQGVSDGLATHVAADTAHGTGSPIVGAEDDQPLNRKRIGETSPSSGRFTTVIQTNNIPAGVAVTIQANEFMVVAGTFTVNGSLTVNGVLAIV